MGLLRRGLLLLLVAVGCSLPAVGRAGTSINFHSSPDVVLAVKHHLGRIKSKLDGEDLDGALKTLKAAKGLLSKWQAHVQKLKDARDHVPTEEEGVKQRELDARPPPEPAAFHIKVTHTPKSCKPGSRRTKLGDTLKVHFVGKLLEGGKKAKAFDSSFHTGSMPYKFTLGEGGGAKVEGWNDGLLDMCQGERRTLTIGWDRGYGEKGRPSAGIPKHADLRFMIELVEFSSGGRRRGRKTGL